ncbi:cordon-bleu protein-like 1 [Uloborus diversus]|uniref:cordon-bleu protein-like 1 n=1 Tax=Uloborus diversus TaxID=327109 RepID=UPI002409CD7D|nr:cordon-bleu protein-like 1 [Uloborus diversus]
MGNMCCRRVGYSPGGLDADDVNRCQAQLPPQRPEKNAGMSGGGYHCPGDDCAINELLEGRMDLDVLLPDGRKMRLTVERRTPMMDLLVQAASASKISPASHVIHVFGPGGDGLPLPYKPSTPIGSLDTNTICIVSKKDSLLQPGGKRMLRQANRPFEPTFRVQVHLPRNQLTVARVSPRVKISELRDMVCKEKGLDAGKYRLVRPCDPLQPLPGETTLADYGATEITLLSNACIESHICSSTSHIIPYSKRAEEQKKTGILRLLAEDVSHQHADMATVQCSQTDSSLQKNSVPPRHKPKKRRPAPPPPPPLEAPSHSRQSSSDSSGYHEATSSFLHEDHAPPMCVSPAEKASSDSSGVSSMDAKVSSPTTQQKKRKAPPPPKRTEKGRAPAPKKDPPIHQELLLSSETSEGFSSGSYQESSEDKLNEPYQHDSWEGQQSLENKTSSQCSSLQSEPCDLKDCVQRVEEHITPSPEHQDSTKQVTCQQLSSSSEPHTTQRPEQKKEALTQSILVSQEPRKSNLEINVPSSKVHQENLLKEEQTIQKNIQPQIHPADSKKNLVGINYPDSSQSQIISIIPPVTQDEKERPVDLRIGPELDSRRKSEPLEHRVQSKPAAVCRRESEPVLVPQVHAVRSSPLVKLDSWETREPQNYAAKTPSNNCNKVETKKEDAAKIRHNDSGKKADVSAPTETESSQRRKPSFSEKRRSSFSENEVTKAALAALNARIEQDVTQQQIASSIQAAFHSVDCAQRNEPSLLAIKQKKRHGELGTFRELSVSHNPPVTKVRLSLNLRPEVVDHNDLTILEPPPKFRSPDKEALVIDEEPRLPQSQFASTLKRSSSLLNLSDVKPKVAVSKNSKKVRQLQRSLSDLTSDDKEEFEAEQERLQKEYVKLQRQFILWQQQLLSNHAMLREECIMPQYARTLRQSHSLPEGEDYSTDSSAPVPLVSRSLSYEPTKDRCSTLPRSTINIPSLEFGSIPAHCGSSTLRSSKTKSYFKPPQVRASTKNRQRLPPEIRKEGEIDITDDKQMMTTILPSFESLKLITENSEEDVLSRLSQTTPTLPKKVENGVAGEKNGFSNSSSINRLHNGESAHHDKDLKYVNGSANLLSRQSSECTKNNSTNSQPPRPPPLPVGGVLKEAQKEKCSKTPEIPNGVQRKNSNGGSRDQLMLEIRKFGGRTALRKISLAS